LFESKQGTDFSQLPQAMVKDMLTQTDEVKNHLYYKFQNLIERRDEYREILTEQGLLRNDSELPSVDSIPTACGVDGAFAIDRLIATDVIAIAGVAVEGLTPPSEKKPWPKPLHKCAVQSVDHSDATSVVLGAIMMCMELELAAKAPHDVIFLDGSMTSPLIYINKALYEVDNVSRKLSKIFKSRLSGALESYATILKSSGTDKIFVGVPKYTTTKEITHGILKQIEHEDRGFLSQVMMSGEFIGPLPMHRPKSNWFIQKTPVGLKPLADEIAASIGNLHVAYYRPTRHCPALRLEFASSSKSDSHLLGLLLECVKYQTSLPGIMEPFPLYLADRMVKKLSTALPAIRRAATQELVVQWDGESQEMFLAMHGYRT
jgi:hypothetical protein